MKSGHRKADRAKGDPPCVPIPTRDAGPVGASCANQSGERTQRIDRPSVDLGLAEQKRMQGGAESGALSPLVEPMEQR